jgi:PKHD-type hydroxylase
VSIVIHHIPNVLTKEQVIEFRRLMEDANWVGGKVTAGTLSASVKQNQQLSEQDPLTHALKIVIKAIWQNPLFQAAALPHKIIPPLFNRYDKLKALVFMLITRFVLFEELQSKSVPIYHVPYF